MLISKMCPAKYATQNTLNIKFKYFTNCFVTWVYHSRAFSTVHLLVLDLFTGLRIGK